MGFSEQLLKRPTFFPKIELYFIFQARKGIGVFAFRRQTLDVQGSCAYSCICFRIFTVSIKKSLIFEKVELRIVTDFSFLQKDISKGDP